MLPWTTLGTAQVPGGDELRLMQRGNEFSIRTGAHELMNNRVHASEDALASLVCERIAGRRAARVLIGGLGMGFTLAAMLRDLDGGAEVVIAELVPEVVAWNRGPLAHVAGDPLSDPRVTVHTGDVSQLIRGHDSTWDAIVLDVDNGPVALTSAENRGLYTTAGLRAAYKALRSDGVLAVWSAAPDPAFVYRMHQARFTVEEHAVRGRARGRGPRFVIWIGRR